MPEARAQPSTEILGMCRMLGFSLAGIADASPTRWADELTAWLNAGKHGDMAYLADQLAPRLDPSLILPGARSIIMVADLYASRTPDPPTSTPHRLPAVAGLTASPSHPSGRIARYARARDYHTVIKTRLHKLADSFAARFPDARFRSFVDTAPILEREYASRAGLGWVGKHTLLIHPRLGSYLLLGGVLTTLDLAAPTDQEVPDHCGACTRCIDSCPTGAISPYSIDARRCISYLTIEHRAPIDPAFHAPIGDWLFGCDICQEVCPHNSPRQGAPPQDESHSPTAASSHRTHRSHETYRSYSSSPLPAYTPQRDSFDLLEVLGWTEDDRRAAFRSSSMKRASLAMMKRNALIVAANSLASPDLSAATRTELLSRIHHIASDPAEPDLARTTAAAVLRSHPTPAA